MKKEKPIKIIAIFSIVAVIFVLAVFVIVSFNTLLLPLYLVYKSKIDIRNAGSIGIIGGADGPTAVFVTGQSTFNWFAAVFALLAIAGIVYLVIAKLKKKNN